LCLAAWFWLINKAETNKKMKFFFTLIFFLINISSSFSQIVLKEVLPLLDDKNNPRGPIAISCSDERNCTLAGYIADSSSGYYLNHLIERSTDGGNTWFEQQTGLPTIGLIENIKLKSVYAIDSLNIVAVGDSGLIIRTTDAGTTWIRQGKPLNISLLSVSFSDPNHGIAVGYSSTICITDDGGKTWNVKQNLTSSAFRFAIAFPNGCYYVFDFFDMHIYHTFNDGKNWDTIKIVTPALSDGLFAVVYDAHFFDSLKGIAVGIHENPDGSYRSMALKTTDGGSTWIQLLDSTNPSHVGLGCVDFADSLFGIAGTSGSYILITRDGGKT
jgi:photosystem II stability/assembly factor-like uncharacterized protein